MQKVAEARKKGKMSKGKKGKRGEREERSNPYKILGKEVEVIGESKKKRKKAKEKEQQQEDSDIKVVFVKQPLSNPSCTSEEGEVTEVDPWKNVHFLEAGVSYGSN